MKTPKPLGLRIARRWRRHYAHGECHTFTTALSEAMGLGWAYECRVPGEPESEWFHSCVRLPDGRALDSFGIVTEAQIRLRYRVPELRIYRVPVRRIARQALTDDFEMATALAVAARLTDLPRTVRAAAHSLQDRQYGDISEDDLELSGGPLW